MATKEIVNKLIIDGLWTYWLRGLGIVGELIHIKTRREDPTSTTPDTHAITIVSQNWPRA